MGNCFEHFTVGLFTWNKDDASGQRENSGAEAEHAALIRDRQDYAHTRIGGE